MSFNVGALSALCSTDNPQSVFQKTGENIFMVKRLLESCRRWQQISPSVTVHIPIDAEHKGNTDATKLSTNSLSNVVVWDPKALVFQRFEGAKV